MAITPASGFVDPVGALIIGFAAGFVCYFSAVWVKRWIGYDDALDAWGVHGVGGALGAMLTGVFASNAINSRRKGWLIDGNGHQMLLQFYDVAATFVYCAIVTFMILKVHGYDRGPACHAGSRESRVWISTCMAKRCTTRADGLRLGRVADRPFSWLLALRNLTNAASLRGFL